jgi:hypothetical protein
MNLSSADLQSIISGVAASQAASQQSIISGVAASQQSIISGVAASQQQSTAELKAFINEALGGFSTRVDAVEQSVSALQTEVAAIKGHMEQIKGDTLSNDTLNIIPSLMAAERVAFAKLLVIKGTMLTNASDLNQFSIDLLNALQLSNDVTIKSISFMSKPKPGQGRLIRLETGEAAHASLIMKEKHKLRSIVNWSNVFINQMRSNMVGKLESRMHGFFRANTETIKMTKYSDSILFVETGIKIPIHKFGAAEIRVGEQVFAVSSPIPVTPTSTAVQVTNQIQTRSQVQKNKPVHVIPAPAKQVKGTNRKKKERNKPYSREKAAPGQAEFTDVGGGEYEDMDESSHTCGLSSADTHASTSSASSPSAAPPRFN